MVNNSTHINIYEKTEEWESFNHEILLILDIPVLY